MPNIEGCLPPSARKHYLRLRNQKSDKATTDYRSKLITLRAEVATSGSMPSGQQIRDEWKLAEELIANLALGWLEAAIETCRLYGIPFNRRLCVCIEQTISELVDAQYRNATRSSSLGLTGQRVSPLVLEVLRGRIPHARSSILNTVRIELEKASVETQKDLEPRAGSPADRSPVVSGHPSGEGNDKEAWGGLEKGGFLITSDSPPKETIWTQMWSWPVVGAVVSLVLAGWMAFITSGHPGAADCFLSVGGALFLIKFWTWEEAKQQPALKKWCLQAAVTLFTLMLAVGAVLWNRAINHAASTSQSGQSTIGNPQGSPNTPGRESSKNVSLAAEGSTNPMNSGASKRARPAPQAALAQSLPHLTIVKQEPLEPTSTDKRGIRLTVTVEELFRNPAFLAECSLPCVFSYGIEPDASSRAEAMAVSSDERIAGVKFVMPGRIEAGKQVILEFRSRNDQAISIVSLKGYRNHLTTRQLQSSSSESRMQSRHTLTEEEQKHFKEPLASQSGTKEVISIDCPTNDEPVCVYAAQFIDLFKGAGWVVDGGIIHRVALGIPYSGVRLGSHVDAPFDPNAKAGTGQWVQITPSLISVQQAFANINIGADGVAGAEIPRGKIEVYFGPEQSPGEADKSLRRSLATLNALRQPTAVH